MKKKLDKNDWDILFSEVDFKIGKTSLKIRPLSITDIPEAVKHFRKLRKAFEDSGITRETYKDNIESLSATVIGVAPGLISLMSGLDEDDIRKLPVATAVSLFTSCLDVNIGDQGDCLKNLIALAEKAGRMMAVSRVISGP